MLSPEEEARKQKLVEELAELLWKEAEPEDPKTLEDIERILRRQGQEHIHPGLMSFFVQRAAGPKTKPNAKGRANRLRTIQTLLGRVSLSQEQAHQLQVRPHTQNSPLLERCLLVCSAKSSFRQAQKDAELLLGLPVSNSTLRRLALSDQRPVTSTSALVPAGPYNRAAVDGGMVRLAEAESGTLWRQYKAIAAEDDQGRRRIEARLGADEFLVRHFSPRM